MTVVNKNLDLPIVKADASQHIAFGWANVTNLPTGEAVVDLQDDVLALADLERAVHRFMTNGAQVRVMHSGSSIGRVVESFLSSPEKLASLGLAPDALPQGWLVGVKVDDDATWARVASGELGAFSIGGRAVRQEM